MLDPATITPSVAEVAALIVSRTRSTLGGLEGTFTADTVPTDVEAAQHAARAARYVALRLGTVRTTAGDLGTAAKDCAAVYAALTIEQSYYADGSDPSQGGADQLGRIAREQLDALVSTARDNQPGGRRIHSLRQITAQSTSEA
ncbi:MAG: hypothetical protein QM679_02920 [Patulibacter sp.]